MAWELLARSLLAGLVVGMTVGAIWGTVEWPIVGTFVFAVRGLLIGCALGVATGVVLIAVSPTGIGAQLRSAATYVSPSAQTWSEVRWIAGRGAGAGSIIGGLAGLGIGLATYPPTAPFAIIEGALFGVVPGAVCGFFAAGLILATRRRAH
jgi:hypothetical protein